MWDARRLPHATGCPADCRPLGRRCALAPKPTAIAGEKGTHERQRASSRNERQQDLLHRDAADMSEDKGHGELMLRRGCEAVGVTGRVASLKAGLVDAQAAARGLPDDAASERFCPLDHNGASGDNVTDGVFEVVTFDRGPKTRVVNATAIEDFVIGTEQERVRRANRAKASRDGTISVLEVRKVVVALARPFDHLAESVGG